MISLSFPRLLLLAVLPLFPACSKRLPPPSTPPPEVLVTPVQQQDVPIYHEYVGSLEGSVNANIQARVTGYLTAQHYKEGSAVKKGDLLFEIDARPFAAALAKAKAALAQAVAAHQQAKLAADRNVELFQKKAVSEQERDNAVLAADAAKAQAEAQRAAADQAQLDLEFTRITAPIEGIAGIARAQVGDLVGPTTGVLTTVSTVDPIKAYFSASEQVYLEYNMRFADPALRSEHERQIEIELILIDGSIYPHKGELYAIDRSIDERTGAVRAAVLFPNPASLLRPGQFARVRVKADLKKGALVVPQRAITEMQGLYLAAVVGPDNKVNVRPVKVGERFGTLWVVEEGLKPGEDVVVEGTLKAREGVTVAPKPWAPPAEKPSAITPAPR